jgi:hypothetical protein
MNKHSLSPGLLQSKNHPKIILCVVIWYNYAGKHLLLFDGSDGTEVAVVVRIGMPTCRAYYGYMIILMPSPCAELHL